MAVYPVNDSELVDLIGKRLEVDLDQMFTLTNLDGGCRYLNVNTHFKGFQISHFEKGCNVPKMDNT